LTCELSGIGSALCSVLLAFSGTAATGASICTDAQSLPASGLFGVAAPMPRPRKICCPSWKEESGLARVALIDPLTEAPGPSAGMSAADTMEPSSKRLSLESNSDSPPGAGATAAAPRFCRV
jgi:hypothetical protein